MRRVRIRIGQMIVRHPNMTAAEGERLGRMVESHLERLMATGGAMSLQNVAVARGHAQLPSAAACHKETAMAIARGIHQGLRATK
jgi:hypothetical protein